MAEKQLIDIRDVKEFLSHPMIQEYLAVDDLNMVYKMYYYSASNLTAFFLKHNIQPLDYLNHVIYEMYYGLDVEEVIIPDNITSIASEAFRNCLDLKRVYIPKSVTTIRDSAFDGCSFGLVIAGHRDSEAHNFAIAHDILFEIVGEEKTL